MVKLSEDGKWYRVSLRLMGDGLALYEIESKLGLVPSHVGKKGEHHRGDPRRAKYQSNVWVWKYPAESDVPFEEQITGLLDVIEPKKSILKEILSLPAVEGELFLGYGSENGQGGAYFSPDVLKRIAECGLSLDLDLYPPGGDEDEANE
jgi:hypothetical protein